MNIRLKPIAAAVALTLIAGPAAAVDYYLAAKAYTKTMPDGSTVPMWGYVEDPGGTCYATTGKAARLACVSGLPTPTLPGPRLTIPPGDNSLRVFLSNGLPEPTSIIIPGQRMPFSGAQAGPTWNDGSIGPRTNATQRVRSFGREAAANGGRRQYVWNNFRGNPIDHSGTFIYHSGTLPQKQVYMGLAGVVTKDNAPKEAYPGVPYDNEVVLFYSDIDPAFNQAVVDGTLTTAVYRHPTWFLVNGQPYSPGVGDISAGSDGSPLLSSTTTLLRFASVTTDTHTQVLQGLEMDIHAEDGNQYNYQDSTGNPVAATPRRQYSVMLPPAKTKDATVVAPEIGRYAVYDGNGYLTNPSDPNNPAVGDTVGGMLRFLNFNVGTNLAPTAVNDSASMVDTAGSVTIDVLANDTDPEADPLSIATTTNPAHGSISCTGGSCVYTLNPGTVIPAGGLVDTFTYTASDSAGNISNAATVTVTITANQPPVAVNDSATVDPGGSVTVPVLANDSDPENDPLTLAMGTASTQGTASCTASDCSYTANAGATGTDSFTYTISDGHNPPVTGTVNITINALNQPPVANADTASTSVNTLVTIDVLANDTDPEGAPLKVATFDAASANGGTVACATGIAGGTCTYTPASGFTGTDTFTYTASDGVNSSASATVTVTVNGVVAPVLQFSTIGAGSVPGVPGPYDDADIYAVDAGNAFTRVKDAINDLNLPNGANIDGLSINGGTIYVSFAGASTSVPGVGTVQDEDVVAFDTATGTWSLYFDGASCGLQRNNGQDVDAISVNGGVMYFSTIGGGRRNPVAGVAGPYDDADVYQWDGTACSRVLDARGGAGSLGLPGNADIDGLAVKNGVYYMSFNRNGGTTVPGLGVVQDESVVSYDPATNTWSLYYSGLGSLDAANAQDIDAIDVP